MGKLRFNVTIYWIKSVIAWITWDNFARNAISLALGAFSPPSESRRTWLAIIPLVHWIFGNECLRVSRGSRNGDSKYGLSGDSLSSSTSSSIDRGDVGSFSSSSDSSTTISGSSTLTLNAGVNDALRIFIDFYYVLFFHFLFYVSVLTEHSISLSHTHVRFIFLYFCLKIQKKKNIKIFIKWLNKHNTARRQMKLNITTASSIQRIQIPRTMKNVRIRVRLFFFFSFLSQMPPATLIPQTWNFPCIYLYP